MTPAQADQAIVLGLLALVERRQGVLELGEEKAEEPTTRPPSRQTPTEE